MELSKYQEDIIHWVTNGEGHGLVEAVAGSGKTTTLEIAAQFMEGSGIFLAFNKHIADRLRHKLAASVMQAFTMHSVGLSALKSMFDGGDMCKLDNTKYRPQIKSLVQRYEDRPHVGKLVDLARTYWLGNLAEELPDIAWEYDIPYKPQYAGVVEQVLDWGKEHPETVDFTDMLWLPVVLNAPFRNYNWVAVDEAQDLSALQFEVVRRLLGDKGRLLAVGDRRQAIFHFAGANAASFQAIADETQAKLMPLSVCYRCPKAVVERAREYCPQIEVAPGAAEGVVENLPRKDLVGKMGPGDMVLCRLTYPLIIACYEFIAKRKRASVRGRNIGQKLEQMIEKSLADKPITTKVEDFHKIFQEWTKKEAERIPLVTPERKLEAALSRHADNCQCIEVIIEKDETISTAGDLLAVVRDLFTDADDSSRVTLSTIHRAKGLESRRVAILPGEWSGKKNKLSSTQEEQEDNLKYVAITRAQEVLYFVT